MSDASLREMSSFKKAEWASIFWTIALLLFVRGYIVEPFKIPSGSMIPTLLVGDHLFVAKSSYDLGLPFTHINFVKVSDPKRGDVVVFSYPNHEENESKDGQYYIKRVIGLPGDQVEVRGGIPIVNGTKVQQEVVPPEAYRESLPNYDVAPSNRIQKEILPGMTGTHWVQRYPGRLEQLPEVINGLQTHTGQNCIEVGKMAKRELPFYDPILLNEVCPFQVPEGQYFVMGDNRDDSADSRDWGFVERKLLKGRALFIWLSTDKDVESTLPVCVPYVNCAIRWKRFGLAIK